MNNIEKILWERFEGGDDRLFRALKDLFEDADRTSGKPGIEFVTSLLERYTFINRNKYDDGIDCIANFISSEFDLSRTLICASTADHTKDSAQMVLYDLTTALGFLGYLNVNTANRYDRAQVFAGKVDNIILVDEFLGTGRSFIGRVKEISSHFKNKNTPVPGIHALVVAGMDFGLRRVAAYVKTIHCFEALRPGLRGFLSGLPLKDAYKILDDIESVLAQNIESQALPRHGDGECEALYARAKGNCPNSVLPIFWWPRFENGNQRIPPFPRVF